MGLSKRQVVENIQAMEEGEDLKQLNRVYDFPLEIARELEKPRGGFFGASFAKLRRLLFRGHFEEFLGRQAEYHARLVRVLNRLSRRDSQTDRRALDALQAELLGLEQRLTRAAGETQAGFTQRLAQVELQLKEQSKVLDMLEQVSRGLERVVMGLRPAEPKSTEAVPAPLDYSYLLLENRFRGSEELIRERLEIYTEFFKAAPGEVLEIGSGRGELQKLFKEQGIKSYGIEKDAAMHAACVESELNVLSGDGLEHLAALADSSLGGIIAIQVVEHLPLPILEHFLTLAQQKLKPGARVIVETINTKSLVPLCQNYFRDPTHAQALHPETLAFLFERAGLRVTETRELSKYPQEAVLQELKLDPIYPPRWFGVVETLNHNVSLLNRVLFGSQDYCIVAEKL